MLQEFKKFIMRGNVIDLAVGVIVGGAFGGIAKSLVDDVIMPPLGLLLGRVDFSNLFITLHDGAKPGPYPTLDVAKAAGAVTMRYGLFLNTIVVFLLTATAIFFVVKAMNKVAPAPVEVPVTRECPKCFTAIAKKATRCSACTSEVEPIADEPPVKKKKKSVV